MKKLSSITVGLALAALVSQSVVANATVGYDDAAWVSAAFGGTDVVASGAEVLSPDALAESNGKVAPLILAFSIAGVDLALMGMFWGVYVPNYGGGGFCSGCTDAMLSSH
jgi:hypothetical protein